MHETEIERRQAARDREWRIKVQDAAHKAWVGYEAKFGTLTPSIDRMSFTAGFVAGSNTYIE